MLGLHAGRTMAVSPSAHLGLPFRWPFVTSTKGDVRLRDATVDTAGADELALTGSAAAWRCLTLLTDSVGQLPIHAYLVDAEGNTSTVQPNPDVLEDPWPLIDSHTWKSSVAWALITRGNAYALPADLDPNLGYPRQLPILNPEAVSVWIADNGLPRYDVAGVEFGPGEIVHFRGYTPPGSYVGIGAVEVHRLGLAMMKAQSEYALGQYLGAGVPSGVVTVDKPELGKDQSDDLRDRWLKAFGRAERTPVFLPRTMTFQPLSFKPEDLEYIESRKHAATEACWMLGVPPQMIGAPSGGSHTYTNVEAGALDFVKYSVSSWTSRIEQVLSKWTPRGYHVRFVFDALLRSTTLDRFQAHALGLDGGWETLNEVRRLEGRSSFGSWADESSKDPANVRAVAAELANPANTPTEEVPANA